MSREAFLAGTFVRLVDAMVDEFDLVDLLTMLCERCVEILDVTAAGLMLVSADGDLRGVAASSDAMRVLEIFEEQSDEGPCPDCFRTAIPVVNVNLAEANGRWPRFAPRALSAGFRSVHALPMRVRDRTIGALNLFRADEGQMADADVLVAQALADIATISIVTQRAATDAQAINEQLQIALNSRILIEQAKGIVAASLDLDMQAAFTRLRDHARNGNFKLADVAKNVIDKVLSPHDLHRLRAHRGAPTPDSTTEP